MKWEVIEKETNEYLLVLRGTETGEQLWTYYATCKWDGCVDFRKYYNGYEYDHECKEDCQCLEDYIHICDVDEFIETLNLLKEKGVEHFKGEDFWSNLVK